MSLGRKASARRVLARLAEARLAEGGRPLDVETLFEVGWPGDRVQEPWRSNRVYVLIAKLRGAGLGEGLAHDGDGYVLAADVDVVPPRE
ncbi:MAG: helix-turn-helix domain-containing protein [Deltaproteobacteria bacterium]|nr:helix-turn-helix domain-containing protein [Deltaproteobacteria bacterium]